MSTPSQHPHVQQVAPNGQPITNQPTKKPWWLWPLIISGIIIAITISGALSTSGSKEAAPKTATVEQEQSEPETTPAEEPTDEAEEPATEPATVEILDMSTDELTFISATYPVKDTWTSKGVIRNVQDGCHQAIQTVQEQIDNWWDYDVIQCMGMADWSDATAVAGSANFTGATLSEVALSTVTGEELWSLAYQTHLMDGLTD